MSANSDLVTVIIPARDEEAFIGPCLDAVLGQDEQQLQIIVVDGASTDRTAEVVRQYAERDARVELLTNPAGIIPVSLNLAVAAARAPWLVRIDAHATVPSNYVRVAVEHLRKGIWAGVGGRKDGQGVTAAGRAIAAVMASRFGVGNSTYHYANDVQEVEHVPFGAYATDVVRQLGGWDERLRVNQDFEFDYRLRRAGHRLLFDPTLTIRWHCRQTVPDLFRQYFRYGRGKVKVAALHHDSIRARHLAAPVLVVSWAVALPLLFVFPWAALVLVLPYLGALVVASVVTMRPLDRAARKYVPGAFVAMHLGWGLGSLRGLWELRPTALRMRTQHAG